MRSGAAAAARRGARAGLGETTWVILIVCLALAVYTALAVRHGNPLRPSSFAYFNNLAHAFLNGHLDLLELPRETVDLSRHSGRNYLYWPPFPAVVLMPFVAVFGIGFSDIMFTILLGGLNVALVGVLLADLDRHRLAPTTQVQRRLILLTFALGSVQVGLASYGRVWYTAQELAFTFVALAFLAAIRLRGAVAFLAVGSAIACAVATRNHIALVGLWPAGLLISRHGGLQALQAPGAPRRTLAGLVALAVAPILLAVGLLLAYNWVRFGQPFDTGLAYHTMDASFRAEFERHGAFSLHYLPRNLFYQLAAYPFPLTDESLMGGSLFLLTPVFLAGFWAFSGSAPRWSPWLLLTSVVVTAVPILLLMGTGWTQFGPRYTFDFAVPLLVLTAMGAPRWPTWLLRLAVLASVLHYLPGVAYLGTRIV